MYRIKQAVVVEGNYDLINLSGFLDAVIIKTNGFGIFKDKEKTECIKGLAKKTGIVILTDSDTAGFKIRNYIKQSVTEGQVLQAYVPDIPGKEKRKEKPSGEGLIGVEGIGEEQIIKALKAAGCDFEGENTQTVNSKEITKTDLYFLGLSGGDNSTRKRQILCKEIGLPSKISSNMLINALNRLMSYEELEELINKKLV